MTFIIQKQLTCCIILQNIVCVLLKLNFPDIICVAVFFSSLKIYCIPLWRRRREHASWRDWSRAQTATSWMLNVQVKKTRGGLIEWTSKHSNWSGKFTCFIQGNIAPSPFYFLPFRQWVNYILSENFLNVFRSEQNHVWVNFNKAWWCKRTKSIMFIHLLHGCEYMCNSSFIQPEAGTFSWGLAWGE